MDNPNTPQGELQPLIDVAGQRYKQGDKIMKKKSLVEVLKPKKKTWHDRLLDWLRKKVR